MYSDVTIEMALFLRQVFRLPLRQTEEFMRSIYGRNEWHQAKHKGAGRRIWRKLHLAVDAACGLIVAQVLTDQHTDGPSQVGPLLDRIDVEIGKVTADGTYDGAPTYKTIAPIWCRYRGGHSSAQDCRSRRRIESIPPA